MTKKFLSWNVPNTLIVYVEKMWVASVLQKLLKFLQQKYKFIWKSFRSSLIRVHTVCLYAKIGLKSLQEYSADDINRQHFQIVKLTMLWTIGPKQCGSRWECSLWAISSGSALYSKEPVSVCRVERVKQTCEIDILACICLWFHVKSVKYKFLTQIAHMLWHVFKTEFIISSKQGPWKTWD